MAINRARSKEYEYGILADLIDDLYRRSKETLNTINDYEEKYSEESDEWYKVQAANLRQKMDAYSAVIEYLEKFH